MNITFTKPKIYLCRPLHFWLQIFREENKKERKDILASCEGILDMVENTIVYCIREL